VYAHSPKRVPFAELIAHYAANVHDKQDGKKAGGGVMDGCGRNIGDELGRNGRY